MLMPNECQHENLLLSSGELTEVLDILQRLVPEYKVLAFGSRVCGVANHFSDLDIAIMTTEPLSFEMKADLAAAFDESGLIFKVDIVDWASTAESFRQIIENSNTVLQEGRS